MSLARLKRLVPPVGRGRSYIDWADVERAMGTALPTDYKQMVETYGVGSLDDFIWVMQPLGAEAPLKAAVRPPRTRSRANISIECRRRRRPIPATRGRRDRLARDAIGSLPWIGVLLCFPRRLAPPMAVGGRQTLDMAAPDDLALAALRISWALRGCLTSPRTARAHHARCSSGHPDGRRRHASA